MKVKISKTWTKFDSRVTWANFACEDIRYVCLHKITQSRFINDKLKNRQPFLNKKFRQKKMKVKISMKNWTFTEHGRIDHFIVVSLVAWPWIVSEAVVDFVLIETSLLFICKSCCSYAN